MIRTTILLLLVTITLKAQKPDAKPFSIGETIDFQSVQLSEKRTLNIYLPDGYDQADTARYPVIYVLDGTANEDFLHIVGLVQFFNMTFNMPNTIVVGIANVDRRRDFTFPTTDAGQKKDFPTTGGSARFIDFLEKEVQPMVQNRYKTSASKMLIGQSLGGLLATEILLKKPDLFDRYCIVSPSLWWDNESLLRAAPALWSQQNDHPRQVYISVGSEGKIMVGDAKGLVKVLNKSGKKNQQVHFVPLPKEDHRTILHLSLYEAFKIFSPIQ